MNSIRRFLVVSFLCPLFLHAEEGPWISLSNQTDLSGWKVQPEKGQHGTGGNWGITAEGLLFGEQDPPGSGNGGLLLTEESFSEFEFEISAKPDWGPDSGIFLRTNDKGEGWQVYVDHHDNGNVGHVRLETKAYSVPFSPFKFSRIVEGKPALSTEIDKRTTDWPDGVYEESCTAEEFLAAWKADDWNRIRIRCTGGELPVIETWINGTKICRFDASKTTHPKADREKMKAVVSESGSIGLQVHGGKKWEAGMRVFWKDARVRKL